MTQRRGRRIYFLSLSLLGAWSLLRAAQEPPHSATDPFQLALALKSGSEYAHRLERAALDFICREEVAELIDQSRDDAKKLSQLIPLPTAVGGGKYRPIRPDITFDLDVPNKQKKSAYLYDYQMTRQAGEIKENRVLLEVNGKKAKDKKDLQNTLTFKYADIFLSSVKLLDEKYREYYDYRLVGEDILNGEKSWLLDVTPRMVNGAYLGGRIHLRQRDGAIMRIDWNPATFGNYQSVLGRAAAYKANPRVVSFTEFGVEKNGLLFPSADLTEEAYVLEDQRIFLRVRTQVSYKEYKFFTVETETDFKKSPLGL
jgi:hypothetical protein